MEVLHAALGSTQVFGFVAEVETTGDTTIIWAIARTEAKTLKFHSMR